MASSRLDIAVAGAGPAGLAAALLLSRSGHRVTVFERFDTPKPLGSGLILQPTGLTVLDSLGLLGEIMELGSRIDRLYGADASTGRTVLDVRYDTQSRGRFGLAVHRAALFSVLHRAVESAGIPVITSMDIETVDVSAATVRVFDVNGLAVGSFDLVVDATGARSKLKSHAAHPGEQKPLPYGAFWASLGWRDGFDPHALTQRYDRASVMIGVLPIGRMAVGAERQAAFFWSLKPAEADAVRAVGLAAWKERVRSLWPQADSMLDQIEDFDQLTLARYGHHTLKVPAGRRLAIIGDAAHSTSPQLGQGANMALLDAAALTSALDTTSGIDEALAAYARSRRLHVRVFQAMSYLFTPFYQSDSTVMPFMRDRLVATLAKVPPAPQMLAAMVSGTLVDPFARIGLTETDWNALPVTAEGASSDTRLRNAV